MARFFTESPISENTRFTLDARAAQHVRVLRMREGERITLFDGVGGEVSSMIVEIGKRDVTIETQSRLAIERELKRHITLCVGLIANDRFDWLIQKVTELGAAYIQPLYTERSQRIPGDIEKRIAHWRGVVIAACEQCGRNRIPQVAAPMSLHEAIDLYRHEASVLMDAEGVSSVAIDSTSAACVVFVGPEGGFSPSELSRLRDTCQYRVRIGETVLRAETAAISAIVKIL